MLLFLIATKQTVYQARFVFSPIASMQATHSFYVYVTGEPHPPFEAYLNTPSKRSAIREDTQVTIAIM